MGRYHYVFPKWSNLLLPGALLFGATFPLYAIYVVAYGFSPATTDVGYMPKQPIPYSHALHAGELGIDCRYCHNTVEDAAHAAIPPTQTCMNCHAHIKKDSPLIQPVRESWETGEPIRWVRVHDLPDYSYFNHSVHVNRGVSCVSCHGRVDLMEEVWQEEKLSMGWCLECHRNPEPHLRDPSLVTNLAWKFDGEAKEETEYHAKLRDQFAINPSQDCSACHR